MTSETESAQRIIGEAPVHKEKEESIRDKFGLPTGFVTEMGSAYRYKDDGRIERDKFDGTRHEQGIAVFIPDTIELRRVLFNNNPNLESSHVPPEKRFRMYITEASQNEDTGAVETRRVFSTDDVRDPSNIYLTTETHDGSKRSAAIRASIVPQIGDVVFEMDKLPDGTTNRHPGHKVTEIIT